MMESYCQIQNRGIYCEKKIACVNSILRKLDLSLKHGIGPATAMALSGFSVVVYNNLNEAKLGLRLAEMAKKMSAATNATRYASLVVLGIGQ